MKKYSTITLDRENEYDVIRDPNDVRITFTDGPHWTETVRIHQLANYGTAYRYGLNAQSINFLRGLANSLVQDRASGQYILDMRTKKYYKK